jgi:hypothetical protein
MSVANLKAKGYHRVCFNEKTYQGLSACRPQSLLNVHYPPTNANVTSDFIHYMAKKRLNPEQACSSSLEGNVRGTETINIWCMGPSH